VRALRSLLAAPSLLVVLLTGCSFASSTPVPPTDAAPSTAADNSDRLLFRTLPEDEPGCSAAVGREGKIVWAGARGMADLSTGRALTTGTTFDIASVSKQFTATAVLLLEQDGRLGLDDPLSRWVTGLPAWSSQVTLEHLMHHTSGIPDYTRLLSSEGAVITDRTTQEQAVSAIARRPTLDGLPGRRFEYSNSNYVLLAEVVRAAAQQSLPEFARSRIFEPLRLDMVIDPHGASPDESSTASARAHVRDPSTGRWGPGGSRWEQLGDGSVQTTPSELVRWADVYRTGELGGQTLLDAQLRTGPENYGAGIEVAPDGALSHTGEWAGFLATFDVSSDRRIAVAVECNGPDAIEGIRAKLREEWMP
jgi:CubicO group peptidase (beta-lactamase class C family)